MMHTPVKLAAIAALLAFSSFVDAGFIQSGQKYYVKHLGGRETCPSKVELLGYLNQTCSAGAQSTANYGPTVGPILRSGSAGKQWKQFILTVVGETPEGDDLVTMRTFYPANLGKPLCQGNVVVEKKNACISEPLAKNVHIHPNQPDVWRISKVKGKTGEYTITAYSRKAPCLRFLGGSSKCDNRYVQLYAKDDGSGQQHWAITPVNPPKPSPSKRNPPPPSPAMEPPSLSPSTSPSPTLSPSPQPSPNPTPIPVPSPTPTPPPTPSPPAATEPGRPTNAVASTASSSTATISWTAPAFNGGSPIVSYRVACVSTSGGPSVGPQTFSASTACSGNVCSSGIGGFTGLQPSTEYTCAVVTLNAVGPSSASAPSNSFTTGGGAVPSPPPPSGGVPSPPPPAATVPLPPAGASVTAVASTTVGTAATVTWPPSSSDGGSPILGYSVLLNDGANTITKGPYDPNTYCAGQVCSSGTDAITGLTAGTLYQVTVKATNAVGTSAASSPVVSMTTVGPPGVPLNVAGTASASFLTATITWDPPAASDATVTDYLVTCTPTIGSAVIQNFVAADACSTSCTSGVNGVTGLAVNQGYSCSVQAISSLGTGPASSSITFTTPNTPELVCDYPGTIEYVNNIMYFTCPPFVNTVLACTIISGRLIGGCVVALSNVRSTGFSFTSTQANVFVSDLNDDINGRVYGCDVANSGLEFANCVQNTGGFNPTGSAVESTDTYLYVGTGLGVFRHTIGNDGKTLSNTVNALDPSDQGSITSVNYGGFILFDDVLGLVYITDTGLNRVIVCVPNSSFLFGQCQDTGATPTNSPKALAIVNGRAYFTNLAMNAAPDKLMVCDVSVDGKTFSNCVATGPTDAADVPVKGLNMPNGLTFTSAYTNAYITNSFGATTIGNTGPPITYCPVTQGLMDATTCLRAQIYAAVP